MDMTPMIDVVFQLIIFFVVTLSMVKQVNENIYLADGKYGEIIKDMPNTTFEIEIDKDGRVSIKGVYISFDGLVTMVRNRVERFTTFPVLIRADQRTKHEHVARVMNLCTANGIWQLSFVAVEKRGQSNTKPK